MHGNVNKHISSPFPVHWVTASFSKMYFFPSIFLVEGSACAVVFDCKFIETSASLHHNVRTLFEGIVRQIRLRRDSKEENARRMANCKRRESISKKAKRFLGRMVARKNKKMAFRQKSKSCHDLSVLWAKWTCRATKTRSCVCFLTLTQGLDDCTEISLHILYCKSDRQKSTIVHGIDLHEAF